MSDWIEHVPGRDPARPCLPTILAPEPGQPCSCWLLGSTVYVRLLHYDRNIRRSVPCLSKEDCPWCLSGMGTRPTGYTACALHGSLAPRVLQLSEAALDAYDMVALVRPDLRGLGVKLARADARRNAKTILTTHGDYQADPLPDEFDPRPSLEYMWGIAAARATVGRTAGQISADRLRRAQRRREAE